VISNEGVCCESEKKHDDFDEKIAEDDDAKTNSTSSGVSLFDSASGDAGSCQRWLLEIRSSIAPAFGPGS